MDEQETPVQESESEIPGETQQDVETSDSSTEGKDVTAESSTAEEGVKKPSMLDAAMAALGKGAEAPPAEESAEKVESQSPEAEEAEAERLPFANHPRYKQLLVQRKEFKAKADELDAKLKAVEPKATHFEQLTNYVKSSGFTSEDFTNLLHLGRLMKNDPIAFHDAFKAHWQQIETMVGARLPADLQQKVNDGMIDPESAAELARKRSEAALNGDRANRIANQTRQEREESARLEQESQRQRFVSDIGNSVTKWESQWKSSDPDYAKKQPRVMDRVMRLLQESPPKSSDEALAICDKAKKQVDDEIRQFFPQKQGIKPSTSGTSVEVKGKPKNGLDAAMLALERLHSR